MATTNIPNIRISEDMYGAPMEPGRSPLLDMIMKIMTLYTARTGNQAKYLHVGHETRNYIHSDPCITSMMRYSQSYRFTSGMESFLGLTVSVKDIPWYLAVSREPSSVEEIINGRKTSRFAELYGGFAELYGGRRSGRSVFSDDLAGRVYGSTPTITTLDPGQVTFTTTDNNVYINTDAGTTLTTARTTTED